MSDLAGKVAKARGQLPLQTLMAQRRKEPSNGNWGRFPHCPYCNKPGAGLRDKNGRQWFKCFHTSCPSGTAGEKGAWDEVGFLAYELGLSRKEAFKVWLKEAGVLWEEPPKRGTERRSEYLPEEEANAYYDDLPPEAREGAGEQPIDPGPDPEPPSDAGIVLESPSPMAVSGMSVSSASAGSAAVPDQPPSVTGLVNVSPAASAGVPTPMPGEASLSPPVSTAGPPAVTSAEPLAPDAAPPEVISVNFQPGVQTSARPEPEDKEDADEDEEQANLPLTVQALRWFHEGLTLSNEDAQRLETKRGLTLESMVALGLRSSLRSNEDLLRAMSDLFPMNALLESGLWERGGRPGDEPKPNPFYFGRGPAGKRKTPLGGEMTFDWVHPILIPYLNRAGQVVDLRTHKWTQKGQAPRLYLPRRLGVKYSPPPEVAYAVIAEAEFKADAIWQALPRALVAALPGISMSKVLWASVLDWLLRELPLNRPVLVVFDNEDKGKEGLPAYKPQWWMRHDTELWARYLALRLGAEGLQARVGLLPDECRDAHGKADWDGWLALLRRELGQEHLV